MQAYSDPAREENPHALPDVETFHLSQRDFICADDGTWMHDAMHDDSGLSNFQRAADLAGWCWWSCFPGCLPDGDANGPFSAEEDALADAQGENA